MNTILRFILSPINKRLYLVAKWAYLGTTTVYLFYLCNALFEGNHGRAVELGLVALSHACLCGIFFILHAKIVKIP